MFNIRVYGIWIKQQSVLLCREFIKGTEVIKFPGGGLEYGEGITDCLKREFDEELGFRPSNLKHFYTTEFFVESIFKPGDQVVSIYFLVDDDHDPDLAKLNQPDLFFFWKRIDEITVEEISLPIDKVVIQLIIEMQ